MKRLTKLTLLAAAAAALLLVVLSRHSLVAAGSASSANSIFTPGNYFKVTLAVTGVQTSFKVVETRGEWMRISSPDGLYWLNTAHVVTAVETGPPPPKSE
jgi:hypothetical protein